MACIFTGMLGFLFLGGGLLFWVLLLLLLLFFPSFSRARVLEPSCMDRDRRLNGGLAPPFWRCFCYVFLLTWHPRAATSKYLLAGVCLECSIWLMALVTWIVAGSWLSGFCEDRAHKAVDVPRSICTWLHIVIFQYLYRLTVSLSWVLFR